jgi:sugar phosphate isomerase/epimerase
MLSREGWDGAYAPNLAFNTSAWWGQSLDTTFEQLAAIGYKAIDLAVHPVQLPPNSFSRQTAQHIRGLARRHRLQITNLSLFDPYLLSERPFAPSISSELRALRQSRVNLLKSATDFAAALGVDLICFDAGPRPRHVTHLNTSCRLIDALEECLPHAEQAGVRLAIRPSPRDQIDSYKSFLELWRPFENSAFGLCLDVAAAHCGFEDLAGVILDTPKLFHVHIADAKDRIFQHRIPGNGGIAINEVLGALQARQYRGALSVNLPAHSLDPAHAARLSHAALSRAWSGHTEPQAQMQ